MNTITVIGAGSWGITLAVHLAQMGHRVSLWEFRSQVAERLKQVRESEEFLPGIIIPDEVVISSRLDELFSGATELVLFVVPSHVLREVAGKVAPHVRDGTIVVTATKGIENTSFKRMSEVLGEELAHIRQDTITALSGPSHAEEVSRLIPTTIVAASRHQQSAEFVQNIFITDSFRVYTNPDIVGVEVAAALKNIIAIAAGISDGLSFGDNTKGALMTRGLAEITRLGLAMGASALTFAGLAGVGDLITTCMSRHSRNRFVGEEIGKGRSLADIQKQMTMVAEGVMATRAVYHLAPAYKVEMPIANEVHAVLFEGKDPARAVEDLMTRTAKAEIW